MPGAPATDWRDWLLLLKPRVVSLVVFTGVIGLYVAPGHIHPVIAFTAILCIAMAAGAAGCLNMWWERDIDALMRRTAQTPDPRWPDRTRVTRWVSVLRYRCSRCC